MAQLAQEGLVDESLVVVVPLVLGTGRTMFEGIRSRLALKHVWARTFANGNALLCCQRS